MRVRPILGAPGLDSETWQSIKPVESICRRDFYCSGRPGMELHEVTNSAAVHLRAPAKNPVLAGALRSRKLRSSARPDVEIYPDTQHQSRKNPLHHRLHFVPWRERKGPPRD